MWIYEGLRLNLEDREILSFIGGGGKTTTIFQLGKELKKLGKKVLITTTTAIYNPEEREYDYYFLKDLDNEFIPKNGTITIIGRKVKDGKLIGLDLFKIEEIIDKKIFDFILIEADGAKGQPIKVPAIHEPVVPESTTKTIGLIGLDCLGEKVKKIVHRPEIFMEVIGKDCSGTVDAQAVVRLVLSDKGLFKGANGERILLLNKAYNEEILFKGIRIREMLLEKGFEDKIIIANIITKEFYWGEIE